MEKKKKPKNNAGTGTSYYRIPSNFNILQWIDREVESCRKAFEQGVLGALKDVLYYCNEYQKPLPQWAVSGLHSVLNARITGTGKNKRGRNAKWETQYKQDMIDFARANTVQDCIEHGIKWLDVYAVVKELLDGTFASGSENTIAKSYKRYRQRSEKEPFRYKTLKTISFDIHQRLTPERLEILKYIHDIRDSRVSVKVLPKAQKP